MNDNPEPFSATPRRPGCLHCGGMVVLLLFALGIIGLMGLRTYAVSQYGAANIARLKSYDTVVLPVPTEWQQPAPLPSLEVVKFQLQFYQEMARLSDQFGEVINASGTSESLYSKMKRGAPISPDEQDRVNQLTAAITPVLKATSSTIELPNYTAAMQLYSTGTDFLQIQNFTRFTSVVAMDAGRRGDCKSAIHMAILPIRYLRHSKPTSLTFDLMRVIITDSALNTAHVIIENCDDITALQQGLDILDELRDGSKPLEREALEVTDVISLANRAAAFGFRADLGPQTRSQLTMQLKDIYGKPYNEWAVSQFPENDPRHITAQGILDNIKEREKINGEENDGSSSIIGIIINLVIGDNLLGVSQGAMLSDLAIPDYEVAGTRAGVMFAKYELTRINLARRIAELDGTGQDPTESSTIKGLIQTVLQDPFSSGAMLLHNETSQFYSVGPDGDDDGMTILYDATNGTLSDGDLYLMRRTASPGSP